jgi:hypothetical protein
MIKHRPNYTQKQCLSVTSLSDVERPRPGFVSPQSRVLQLTGDVTPLKLIKINFQL